MTIAKRWEKEKGGPMGPPSNSARRDYLAHGLSSDDFFADSFTSEADKASEKAQQALAAQEKESEERAKKERRKG